MTTMKRTGRHFALLVRSLEFVLFKTQCLKLFLEINQVCVEMKLPVYLDCIARFFGRKPD